ncbi:hypothetical protein [Paenibacillus sp. Y412MC10]|uniref:hypothetical protein n=1 Tax=Geobacillus sp. (strain Y412MC10) TaxID=481743 RepID=UPI0011AB87A0|nr:hypothetical protein [Paenibacillus sp. Y412MC10]
MQKAWSQHLYRELDISDKKGFDERLRKDIKKNPGKYRLTFSECKMASVKYARGEKREYFTTYETNSANYVPHRQNCSYAHQSSIASRLGSQFATVQVSRVEKEIELDFTSFLNQDENGLDITLTDTDKSKWDKPGRKRLQDILVRLQVS